MLLLEGEAIKKILAIDPGEVESAWVEYLPEIQQIVSHGKTTNEGVINVLIRSEPSDFAIEMVQCFGMPVGRETFETCLWIGRFLWEFERFEYKGINPSPVKTAKIFRKTVCGHICNNACAKDSNIRQALIDRFGGSKDHPAHCIKCVKMRVRPWRWRLLILKGMNSNGISHDEKFRRKNFNRNYNKKCVAIRKPATPRGVGRCT